MPRTPVAELILSMSLAAVAGCATTESPQPETGVRQNSFIGDEPVFAVLRQQADGEWSFDQVTRNNEAPEHGFLVRLNDLAPAFDTRRAECEPRPYREGSRCNPLNPFREKDVGVVSKIVDSGISAGTGGTIESVSRSYTTTFDHLEFNAAVDRALLTTGLDQDRVDLIDGLTHLKETIAAQDDALRDLASRIIGDYERDRENGVRFDLTVTGLDQYYSHDLDPADIVEISAREPSWSSVVDTSGSADLLPCSATRCMQEVREAVRRAEAEHEARMSSLRANLNEQTSSYDVDCSATGHRGYHFEMSCPPKLSRNPGGIMELAVGIHIRSRDFDHLFPQFSDGDGSLVASIESGRLVLENLTNDFIEVESVSIYYNSHVNTVSDDSGRLDLAPHQTVTRQASLFSSPAIDVESKHANMTPDKARRSRFTFGLAVKYSLGNRNEIETIYAVDDYQVQCAIENRLRPGSCDGGLRGNAVSAVDE